MPGSNGNGVAPEGGGGYTKPSTASSSTTLDQTTWANTPDYMKQYDKTATVTETSGGITTVKSSADMSGLGSSAMSYANAEGDAISDMESYLNTPQYMKEYYNTPEENLSVVESEYEEGEFDPTNVPPPIPSKNEGEQKSGETTQEGTGEDEQFDFYLDNESKFTENILSSGHGTGASNQGFYYDVELNDPFLSISLHPNTVLKDTEGAVEDGVNDDWKVAPGPYLKPTTEEIEGITYYDKYSVTPIARAIMSEEFSVSINNEWANFSGNNPIESAYDSIRQYAPIISDFGKNWGEGIDQVSDEGGFGSDIVNFINDNIAKPAANVMKKMGGFMNNALVVQGTKFTYYQGTTFGFGNMTLKFIKLSDWEIKEGSPVFVPVTEYIKGLDPYVMGKYHPIIDENQELTGIESADKFIRTYCGYQSPPAGFRMHTLNLGNILRGTMRIIVGGKYTVPNLVLKTMDVVFSKAQAKDPRPERAGKTVPLYAEITLTLQPACMFIDSDYEKFTGTYGTDGYDGAAISRVEDKYRDTLEKMVDSAKTHLGLKS